VLACVYLGHKHRLPEVLGDAISDPMALDTARIELGAIPALTRRRLLATYAALLPARRRIAA